MKFKTLITGNYKLQMTSKQSKKFQTLFFSLGGHWGLNDRNVSLFDRVFYFTDDLRLTHGNLNYDFYTSHENKQIYYKEVMKCLKKEKFKRFKKSLKPGMKVRIKPAKKLKDVLENDIMKNCCGRVMTIERVGPIDVTFEACDYCWAFLWIKPVKQK